MPFDNTPTEITVDTPASLAIEAGIKLIEQPEHWCRGAPMMFLLGGGVAYCAWGAVRESMDRKVAPVRAFGLGPAEEALEAAAKRYYYKNIADLNDDPTTTHAMVLQVMREAAELARSKNNV